MANTRNGDRLWVYNQAVSDVNTTLDDVTYPG